MKVVSWNCRGLGRTNKVESIRNTIKTESPDILLIQETKMSVVEVLALSHCSSTINQGKVISCNGSSRGIAIFLSSKYVIKNVKENQFGSSPHFEKKMIQMIIMYVMCMVQHITVTSNSFGAVLQL